MHRWLLGERKTCTREAIKMRATAALASLLLLVATTPPSSALDNGLTKTPPRGWSSWNKYHCGISEVLIKGIADAVVSSGLAAAGYDHINLDDCWMDAARDANGDLQGDKKTFPSGMKALGDYLHGKKLRFGLYLDPGTKTCQRRPGSFQHEAADAKYLARVGADCESAEPVEAAASARRPAHPILLPRSS